MLSINYMSFTNNMNKSRELGSPCFKHRTSVKRTLNKPQGWRKLVRLVPLLEQKWWDGCFCFSFCCCCCFCCCLFCCFFGFFVVVVVFSSLAVRSAVIVRIRTKCILMGQGWVFTTLIKPLWLEVNLQTGDHCCAAAGIYNSLKEEEKWWEHSEKGYLFKRTRWQGYEFWYFEHTVYGMFRNPLFEHRY